MKFSPNFYFGIFVRIFMKFSPKCIAKNFGIIYTFLEVFAHGPIFEDSKWVWSGNTTITNRRQPCGTARKRRSTITRHQEDKLSKATSSPFPIKMIAILERTQSNVQQNIEQLLPLEHDHGQTNSRASSQRLSAAHPKVTWSILIGFKFFQAETESNAYLCVEGKVTVYATCQCSENSYFWSFLACHRSQISVLGSIVHSFNKNILK